MLDGSDDKLVDLSIEERADTVAPPGPSAIAAEISRIKHATVEAAAKRSRLPQPLFWSLFHAALDDLRRQKEQQRLLSSIFEEQGGS